MVWLWPVAGAAVMVSACLGTYGLLRSTGVLTRTTGSVYCDSLVGWSLGMFHTSAEVRGSPWHPRLGRVAELVFAPACAAEERLGVTRPEKRVLAGASQIMDLERGEPITVTELPAFSQRSDASAPTTPSRNR